MYCVTLYLFFIRWWCNLNEFLPNLTSNLCPVEFQIWPGMKYWSNWVEIHCMPPWSNWVSSQWIQLASISMDLLPIRPAIKYWSNWLEIYWEYIVCLPGWFGCKFIEITLHAWSDLVAIISMDLLPIQPVEFQIRPVFHARSNLTGHEILVKMGVKSPRLHLYACLYIVWLPGQIWWS